MKCLTVALLSTCLLVPGLALAENLTFKSLDAAQKYCPDAGSIRFKPGLPAPGPLAKISFLTASFTATKNNKSFMNSLVDNSCPEGTANAHAIISAKDAEQAKKSGANICLVIPVPVTSDQNLVEHIDFYRSNGNFGAINGDSIRCNYKYTGIVDPETKKPLTGLLVLRSQ